MRIARLIVSAGLVLAAACATPTSRPGQTGESDLLTKMNDVAPAYVKLVLAVGRHDKDYVDAFYGPAEWKTEVEAAKKPLDAIAAEAESLLARLRKLPEPSDEMLRLRRSYLTHQLESLAARVAMLRGKKLSFDEESRALYDAVAPTHSDGYFEEILKRLEARIPGGRTDQPTLRRMAQAIRHSERKTRHRFSARDQSLPRTYARAPPASA